MDELDSLVRTNANEPGPFVVPLAIVSDLDAVLSSRSPGATAHVLGSVLDGSLLLDPGEHDVQRITELMHGRPQPRLSFAEAAVLACAERIGAPVLTFAADAYGPLAADMGIELVRAER